MLPTSPSLLERLSNRSDDRAWQMSSRSLTKRSLDRFLRLRLDRLAHRALSGQPLSASTAVGPKTAPNGPTNPV